MSHMLQVAAVALSKASAFDNRKMNSQQERELTIRAWAEALHPDTTQQDVLDAITEHYRSTTAWIMPAHINKITAGYRAARLNLDTLVIPVPDGLGAEPAVEVAWQSAWLAATKAGDSPDTASIKAWAAIGRSRPREIESTQKQDIKTALEKYRRQFGKRN